MRLCRKNFLDYRNTFCKFESICPYSIIVEGVLACHKAEKYVIKDKNKNKLSLFVANILYEDMLYNSCSINLSELKDSYVIDKINNLIRSKIGLTSTVNLSSKTYSGQTNEFLEEVLFSKASMPVGKRLEVIRNRVIVLIEKLTKEEISFYDEVLDLAIKDLLDEM